MANVLILKTPNPAGFGARISAFSESIDWKGKIPSMDLKLKQHEYLAHNFPMNIAQDFFRKAKSELSLSEIKLKAKLKDSQAKYVIVISTESSHDLDHEMLHAKYYLDSDYRKKIIKIWNKGSSLHLLNHIERLFSHYGYHESVHIDEFQAYLLTEKITFWPKKHHKEIECVRSLIEKIDLDT